MVILQEDDHFRSRCEDGVQGADVIFIHAMRFVNDHEVIRTAGTAEIRDPQLHAAFRMARMFNHSFDGPAARQAEASRFCHICLREDVWACFKIA